MSDTHPSGDRPTAPEAREPAQTAPRGAQVTESKPGAARPVRFRTIPVLAVVLIAVLIVGLIAAGAFFEWDRRIAGWFAPPLVPAAGRVVYQDGTPVTTGQIQTAPIGRNLRGAYGTIDPEGRFTLMTDMAGRYVEGAYAGPHKVAVVATGATIPGAGVEYLVDSKYASLTQTPLQIELTRDPEQNQFELTVERPKSEKQGAGKGAPKR